MRNPNGYERTCQSDLLGDTYTRKRNVGRFAFENNQRSWSYCRVFFVKFGGNPVYIHSHHRQTVTNWLPSSREYFSDRTASFSPRDECSGLGVEIFCTKLKRHTETINGILRGEGKEREQNKNNCKIQLTKCLICLPNQKM